MHQSLSALSDESLILPTTLLNPTLKRALGVLDARLEDELTRYRRYRNGLRVSPSAATTLKRSASKPAALKQIALPVAAPPVAEVKAPVTVITSPPPPPLTPMSLQNDPVAAAAITSLVLNQPDQTVGQEHTNIQLTDIQFTDRLIDEKPSEDHFATDRFAAEDAEHDYMASSEGLLRSLAEEEAGVASERNVLESLLTPFGVGSMMLMLLGSGMFGYLIMNPASLDALKGVADRIASFRSRPTTASNRPVDILGGSGTSDMGWLSTAPALDSDQFMSLSLNNFSALRTRPGGNGLAANGLAANANPNLTLTGMKPRVLPNQKNPKPSAAKAGLDVLKNFAPLSIQPLVPPAPAIAGGTAPIRVAKSYEDSYSPPAPQIQAPALTPAPYYAPPRQPARSYEPPAPVQREYVAPARSYQAPAPAYQPPAPASVPASAPASVVELPPPPALESPAVVTAPQGDYRVVSPYTNDADLEAAQKADPNASFRNLEDGAYIQRGTAYGSKAEAEAAASQLKQQGVEAEVK
jgi:hypothetical protein